MIKLSFAEAARILSVPKPKKRGTFVGLSIDTRTVKPGNLFVAIVGKRVDGHDFVSHAKTAGAVAALVSRPDFCVTDMPCFPVADVTDALGVLAHDWRMRFKCPMIAVTGSNGKTTVKEMIAQILKTACSDPAKCLVSEGNLNNHIGVPLNLVNLNEDHQYAVLEMGMNHFGEIAYLSQMARPDIAVITNAYPSHLEGVGDLAGVAQAKGEIFQGLAENGKAILNADDAYAHYWSALIDTQEILTFGIKKAADVMACDIVSEPAFSTFTLYTPLGSISIRLPVAGEHNIQNALAAVAVACALKIDLKIVKTALEAFQSVKNRLLVKTLSSGQLLIDDTYNANPASLRAAINTLMLHSGLKVLVLGDMKELGSDAARLHHLSGEYAKEAGVDFLFTFGELAENAVTGFGENAFHDVSKPALIERLKTFLNSPETPKEVVVLVKGSRSMHMEEVVQALE